RRALLRRHVVLVGGGAPRHARPVLVGEHVQHALGAQRRAGVDTGDAPFGDRRGDDGGVSETRRIGIAGVFGGSGDLGAAVDAGCGCADKGHGAHRIFLLDCDCGAPAAAWLSARTMARRASSILNVLCSKPRASRRIASAARAKASRFAGWPRSAASAAWSRHGLCATPPSASRASLIVSPSSSSAAATETSANA